MQDTFGFLAKTRGVDVANSGVIIKHQVDIFYNTEEFILHK